MVYVAAVPDLADLDPLYNSVKESKVKIEKLREGLVNIITQTYIPDVNVTDTRNLPEIGQKGMAKFVQLRILTVSVNLLDPVKKLNINTGKRHPRFLVCQRLKGHQYLTTHYICENFGHIREIILSYLMPMHG
ncbi:hypothetical protein CAPTEDRAFT_214361 [Capitella teleta]|uniref:Uncharacterized protein n=1 Tax=Capitella teleta TaxID=283909 RepID=R7TNX9_CAPTE|nr:hypothetical protein CAPTEDRAFT_214361 [Capitella teleta]|eukprot:ELT92760.1 hypothetical protein CAPTEDRAFT_214361 [Capitella teleta]